LAHYAYMVRCCDGTFYSGYTNDLTKRLCAHNSGTGAKYTRSRRPVTLVYYEEFCHKAEAMRREAALKKLTHGQKLALAEGMVAEDAHGEYHKTTKEETP